MKKGDIVVVKGTEYLVTEVGSRGVFGVKVSTVNEAGTAGDKMFLGAEERVRKGGEL